MFTVRSWTILLIICALLLRQVENKAIFGIGMRIIDDQLLLKDVLQSPPSGLSENPTIGFNYAIPEPITYIEIVSEENVFAEVNFSYHNDLVKGTIMLINTTRANALIEPFEVLITIYGFNHTMLNVNPAYILNKDQSFEGILEPLIEDGGLFVNDNASDEAGEGDEGDDDDDEDDDYETVNADDDAVEILKSKLLNVNNADDNDDGDDGDDVAHSDNDFDRDFQHLDKIIELGHRQTGDYLVYDTYQTSATSTEQPTNHSVVFYYVDSNFITYAKFVIFDHFVDKSKNDYDPPTAEYSHYSPHSLKAVITDYGTTSLFVQMFLYGYKRTDLPVDYIPFLPKLNKMGGIDGAAANTIATESPMSILQQLYAPKAIDKHDDNDKRYSMAERQDSVFASNVDNLKKCLEDAVNDATTMVTVNSSCLWTMIILLFSYFILCWTN